MSRNILRGKLPRVRQASVISCAADLQAGNDEIVMTKLEQNGILILNSNAYLRHISQKSIVAISHLNMNIYFSWN